MEINQHLHHLLTGGNGLLTRTPLQVEGEINGNSTSVTATLISTGHPSWTVDVTLSGMSNPPFKVELLLKENGKQKGKVSLDLKNGSLYLRNHVIDYTTVQSLLGDWATKGEFNLC